MKHITKPIELEVQLTGYSEIQKLENLCSPIMASVEKVVAVKTEDGNEYLAYEHAPDLPIDREVQHKVTRMLKSICRTYLHKEGA